MKFLSGLKNTVMYSAVEKSCSLFEQHTELAEEAMLKPRFLHVAERKVVFSDTIKTSREVVALEEEDSQRDLSFSKMMNVLKGYRDMPFEDKSDAAAFFIEIVNRHGGKGIVNLPNDEETAILTSMESEFNSEKALDLLKKIDGVAELAKSVFLHNAKVKELSVKKAQVIASNKTELSATDIKKELVSYFNKQILGYLEVMSDMQSDLYGSFASEIFAVVKAANDTVPKKSAKK